jgi:DNA replication protein DnaC
MTDYAEPCPTCKGGHAERVETVKKTSSIPVVFYDKNYESFNWNIYRDNSGKIIDMTKKKNLVEDFLKGFNEWSKEGLGLYIHSKTKGSGKTFLASCLCNELMERYAIKTRFVSATNLLDIAQSGDQNSPDEYKREPIKLLCNCKLLVLDDIGQKKTGAQWMDDILFRIVDDRYTQKLVTIYTSNMSIQGLEVDERIKERMIKVACSVSLPEYNVRAKESYEEKLSFLKKRGLIEGGD